MQASVALGTAYLGVDGLEKGLLPKVLLCAHQGLPDGRLATASRTQQEDRPAHNKDLTQLADLEAEGLICLVAQLQRSLLDLGSMIAVSDYSHGAHGVLDAAYKYTSCNLDLTDEILV